MANYSPGPSTTVGDQLTIVRYRSTTVQCGTGQLKPRRGPLQSRAAHPKSGIDPALLGLVKYRSASANCSPEQADCSWGNVSYSRRRPAAIPHWLSEFWDWQRTVQERPRLYSPGQHFCSCGQSSTVLGPGPTLSQEFFPRQSRNRPGKGPDEACRRGHFTQHIHI
jgi:hypothetical protein